jgi:hypothetical protein
MLLQIYLLSAWTSKIGILKNVKVDIFTRDEPIISSERTLHKGYDLKGSVVKKSGRGSQGA